MFNELPLDVQANILKYNPSMRSLNKTFHHYDYLFYEQQCTLPISRREFLNYINQSQPSQFNLYYKTNFSFVVYQFYKHLNGYIVDYYSFYLYTDYIKYRFTFKSGSIDQLLNLVSFNEHLYFDVLTIATIFQWRSCQPYIQDYIKLQFNDFNKSPIQNLYASLFNLIKNNLYLLSQYDLYNNTQLFGDFMEELEEDNLVNEHLNEDILRNVTPLYQQQFNHSYQLFNLLYKHI